MQAIYNEHPNIVQHAINMLAFAIAIEENDEEVLVELFKYLSDDAIVNQFLMACEADCSTIHLFFKEVVRRKLELAIDYDTAKQIAQRKKDIILDHMLDRYFPSRVKPHSTCDAMRIIILALTISYFMVLIFAD